MASLMSFKNEYSPLNQHRDENFMLFPKKDSSKSIEELQHIEPRSRKHKQTLDFALESRAAPWMSEETAGLSNSNIKFHNEILELAHYLEPKAEDWSRREEIISEIKELLRKEIAGCQCETVGCFEARFHLPYMEVEIVVNMESVARNDLLKQAAKILTKHHTRYTCLSIDGVNKTLRVKAQELKVEISFNRKELIAESEYMKKNFKEHRELKLLMYPMMIFLRQRDLDGMSQGGVGIFLLQCMLVAVLKYLKKKLIDTRGAVEAHNVLVSETCLKMLEFYGLHFDASKQKIVMNDADCFVEKKENKEQQLSLTCPEVSDVDIGARASRCKEVLNCMKNRFFFLTNYNFLGNESVLKHLINPSKIDFSRYLV